MTEQEHDVIQYMIWRHVKGLAGLPDGFYLNNQAEKWTLERLDTLLEKYNKEYRRW